MDRYPVEKRFNAGALIFAIVLGVISITTFASSVSGASFAYNASRITAGIVAGIIALAFLSNVSNKVYIIKCPHCGDKMDFPVNGKGEDCPTCKKRVIMVDGIIKKVEE